MKVLVVTWPGDAGGIDGVTAAIEARGASALHLRAEEFPHAVRVEHHQDASGDRVLLHGAAGTLDLSDLTSVWYRRRRLPHAGAEREAALDAARLHLGGLVERAGVFVLDPLRAARRVDHEARQGRLAQAVGLDVPRSLFTNDPAAARAFVASCPDGAAAKPLYPPGAASEGPAAGVVPPEAFEDLPARPWAFRERVPAALAIRVAVIGDRLFAVADPGGAAWRPYTLVVGLEERLVRLGDVLGQSCGVVDLALSREGRFVYLGWDPAGEVGAAGLHHRGPMEEAWADLLLGAAPQRAAAALGRTGVPRAPV